MIVLVVATSFGIKQATSHVRSSSANGTELET